MPRVGRPSPTMSWEADHERDHPLQFEAHAVRVQVDELGQPWFNATDVCDALEMGNPSRRSSPTSSMPRISKNWRPIDGLGRQREPRQRSGLYALILGTKDAAKRFKRWITGEVLPAIRKTGAYSAAHDGRLARNPQDRVTAILLIGEAVAKGAGRQDRASRRRPR